MSRFSLILGMATSLLLVSLASAQQATRAAVGSENGLGVPPPVASVFDRSKDSTPDAMIVPAGTEMRVDLGSRKTIVPIRVGFATAIPALSQITTQVTRSKFNVPNFAGNADNPGAPSVDYIESVTITKISVDGKAYGIHTDSLLLQRGGTHSELTFILSKPLIILR